MDRSQAIGTALLFALFYLVVVYNSPTEEEQAAMQQRQDSLNMAQQQKEVDTTSITEIAELPDTINDQMPTEQQSLETFTLKNDKIELTFSNKGAQIVGAVLQDHFQILKDEDHNKTKRLLPMMDHPENLYEYRISGVNGQSLRTGDIYFSGKQSGNRLTFSSNSNGVPFNIV